MTQQNIPDLTYNNYLLNRIFFDQVFTPEECKMIRELKLPLDSADNPFAYQNAVRRFIPHTPEYEWIIVRVAQKLYQANEFFNQDIVTIMGTNIVDYQVNGYLRWHVDVGPDIVSTRKLSSVIFLSTPEEYEGGKLVWFPPQPDYVAEQGSMVIFPSYMTHRVEPVTKGFRQTLVSWAHGPAFR